MLAVAPDRVSDLPAAPGAYLFLDGRGRLLYVGRAGALRSRVRSYWSASLDRPGLRRMVRRVRRVIVAPAASEHEAALLERVLLERLDPPFNRTQGVEVFVGIRVCVAPPEVAAVVELGGAPAPFGPYLGWAPALAAASALARLFPLHLCRAPGELGALQRDIARRRGLSTADAPVVAGSITRVLERDAAAVAALVARLERERDQASELRLYERAAEIQRQIAGVGWIVQPQALMRLAPNGDRWLCDEERIAAITAALG